MAGTARNGKERPGANPAKVADFGGARDQEKWLPVFRPIHAPTWEFDHVYHFRPKSA